MSRATWDTTWMLVARAVSHRSACVRAQVGAVIVDSTNRIVATGYNGPPAGFQRQCVDGCPRSRPDASPGAGYDDCVSIHAEANALLFCDRRDREGGTMYVTAAPCFGCAKLIANSGLKRVLMYPDQAPHRNPKMTIDFMRSCGLTAQVYR